MIGGLGTTELIIILAIVMIVFGAGRLPEVGGAIGKGIRNFRSASRGDDERDVTPEGEEDQSLPNHQTRETASESAESTKSA